MNVNIDFEKSVRRQRLIYHGTMKQRFLLSLRSFLSGIFILIVFLALIVFAYFNNPDPFTLILLSIPTLLVIISMALQNRLVRTESARIQDDQTAIFRFLLRKYYDVEFSGIFRVTIRRRRAAVVVSFIKPHPVNTGSLILRKTILHFRH